MAPPDVLVLGRRDVARLLNQDACIAAVEDAFRLHGEGRSLGPGVLGIPSGGGGFHVKAAGLVRDRTWFAAKCNGNFSDNPSRCGLPAIQGVVVLCDGETGSVLALLDSIEITLRRTGAATAVAARHLARRGSRVVAICGCGSQGRAQLLALSRVLPLERARAWDQDPDRARAYATEMSEALGIAVEPAADPGAAARGSDVCVTCTPSRRPFLRFEDVDPGTFVAAVGADSPDKQELHVKLLAKGVVVVDALEQCAAIGELHHALASGAMSRDTVRAEIHDVVTGRRPGRASEDEIVIFDSTGTALEDVAAAVLVYEKAVGAGLGLRVALGA